MVWSQSGRSHLEQFLKKTWVRVLHLKCVAKRQTSYKRSKIWDDVEVILPIGGSLTKFQQRPSQVH